MPPSPRGTQQSKSCTMAVEGARLLTVARAQNLRAVGRRGGNPALRNGPPSDRPSDGHRRRIRLWSNPSWNPPRRDQSGFEYFREKFLESGTRKLMNNLNRGLGLADAYPFVLASPAIEKLRFVHETIVAVATG